MTEKCPRCNTVMVLQKGAANYSRQSFLYCQKCQTMIFLPSGNEMDQLAVLDSPLRKPKVLLVDDETDLLTILDLQFKAAGFDTILASNGEDAYTKLLESSPDAVVSDIFLPTMDGWELTNKIRGNSALGYVPLILLTGIYTGPEFKSKALEHGVDAFVTKPYNHELLLNIVNQLIEKFSAAVSNPPTTVTTGVWN